jgi:hypothetical protein
MWSIDDNFKCSPNACEIANVEINEQQLYFDFKASVVMRG